MSRSILLIDDDPKVLSMLAYFFEAREWVVSRASGGRAGVELYEAERHDLVLCDLDMPALNGLQVLEVLRARDPHAVVLILTGHADVSTAVQALHLGAENFLAKPIDFEHLEAAVERAYEKVGLRRHNQLLARHQIGNPALAPLARSERMREIADQINLLADGNAPVLLGGETGTGKGWIAKLIHSISGRARAPFVEVNCAGLSSTFLDSELFGHEKGAFTDAKAIKKGLFEVAHGGTIFLDEIGDLAPEVQPKLLKVLESKRFRRLGGTRELEVDVRLVAATHKDLQAEVAAGRFREDLFYRLAVFPLVLPPLRERGSEEIAALAHALLAELWNQVRRGPRELSTEALHLLVQHSWPGNIRELRNVLERAQLMATRVDAIGPEHLPPDLRRRAPARVEAWTDAETLESVERRHIARMLDAYANNRTHTARSLGITRATLYKKMRLYGLEN